MSDSIRFEIEAHNYSTALERATKIAAGVFGASAVSLTLAGRPTVRTFGGDIVGWAWDCKVILL